MLRHGLATPLLLTLQLLRHGLATPLLLTLHLRRHGLATPLLLTLHLLRHGLATPLEFVEKTKAAEKLCCCRMAHRATTGCASNTKCCCDSATIAKVSSVCGDTSKDVDTSGFTLDPWMPTGH